MPTGPDSPYAECSPPAALAPVLECGWTHRGTTGAQQVLPDGCLDILIDCSTGLALVIGAMSRPLGLPAGDRNLLAVRFRPGAAPRCLGPGVHRWTDGSAELRDVWPDADLVVESLLALPPARRMAGLFESVAARITTAADLRVSAAVDWLRQGRGNVAQLSEELGVSRQYLARQFKSAVGLSPKAIARVFRMQRAKGQLSRPVADQVEVALAAGYFDQAHMIAEFQKLVGQTPGSWRAAATTSFHFSNP